MIKEYTFTGYMPSGNPFLWYYDETQRTAFTTGVEVATWSKTPEVGDKIKIEKNEAYENNKVWVNDELVFELTEEKRQQKQTMYDQIYDNLKKEKGLTQNES